MELPPYRLPTLKGVLIHVWERAWVYIKKAGTVILGFAIVMWFLMSYPRPPASELAGLTDVDAASVTLRHSVAGCLGQAIEPAVRPLGLDWKAGIALLAGFGAKEVVVSTLGTVYSIGDADEESSDLRAALRADPTFSPLVACVLMTFVLIYVPCMSVVAVIRRETGSWKWPVFAITYTCALAWIVSFLVYHGGKLLGYG